MHFETEHVRFMPKDLKPGILYISEEFETAAHLCPCGCGSKIRTPLGPVEWSYEETEDGPSLKPSIGNWQLPCRTHYWIKNGEVEWAEQWTDNEVRVGRDAEHKRRQEHYASMNVRRSWLQRVWTKVKQLLGL